MTIVLCCPECGEREALGTEETLAGTAHADFHIDAGERLTNHHGETDVAWDSSETTGVCCRSCWWSGQIDDLLTPDQYEAKKERGE